MNNEESLKKIKEISLEGLLKFKDICEKHNLKYSLAYGTMIGAVRHGGFIPWDDDIDLWMPRDDYEKFLKIQYEDDEWKLLSYKNEKKYLFSYAKFCHKNSKIIPSRFCSGLIYGTSIDIFPLDNIDYKKSLEFKTKISNIYNKYKILAGGKRGIFTLIKRMIKKIYFFYQSMVKGPYFEQIKNVENEVCATRDNKYVSCIFTPVPMTIEKEKMNNYKTINFENNSFLIFDNYDSILTKIYGDYMKLPPIEKRITHHTFSLVIKK